MNHAESDSLHRINIILVREELYHKAIYDHARDRRLLISLLLLKRFNKAKVYNVPPTFRTNHLKEAPKLS